MLFLEKREYNLLFLRIEKCLERKQGSAQGFDHKEHLFFLLVPTTWPQKSLHLGNFLNKSYCLVQEKKKEVPFVFSEGSRSKDRLIRSLLEKGERDIR